MPITFVDPSGQQYNSETVTNDVIAQSYNPDAPSRGGSASDLRPNGQSMLDWIEERADSDNAWSASEAAKQRDWQSGMVRQSQDFNAFEAEKNRKWQEYMSSSAHQREVADLMAAGLNPMLAVMGGNGAPVGSGATAASGSSPGGAKGDVSSPLSAVAGIFGTMLQNSQREKEMLMSANTALAVADKYNAQSKYATDVGASTQRYAIDNQTFASMYGHDVLAAAQRHGADAAAEAAKYGADKHEQAMIETATIEADKAGYITRMQLTHDRDKTKTQLEHDEYMHKYYPQNMWGTVHGLNMQLGDYFGW